MNDVKHTQGPWRAKRLATYQEPGCVVLWSDKGGAHMRRLDYQGNFTNADAALISAAPELLETLQALETLFAPLASDSTAATWIDKARAAIAKATREVV